MEDVKFWRVYLKRSLAKINFEIILQISHTHGYRLSNSSLVQIVGNKIYFRDEHYYFNELKSLIKEPKVKLELIAKDRFERDMISQGKKLIQRLQAIDESKILKDQRSKAYKFYLNGYISITKDGIEQFEYSSVGNMLIWNHKIRQRNWTSSEIEDCLYAEFLQNSIGISLFTKSIIGYLSHDFNEEGKGYLLVLTDQVEDKRDGGGTGKNLFCVLLKETINILEVSAEQIKYDSSLLQSWNGERIFNISDAGKKFTWEFLKNIITGNTQQKKLYRDERTISYADMPKFLVSTNLSVPTDDGGLNRRIRVLEFSPFYKLNKGVDIYHGGYFPEIWTESDWEGYDNFIAKAIQLYFMNNSEIEQVEISDSGELKRFKLNYGEDIFDFIETHFDNWTAQGKITTDDFNKLIANYTKVNKTNDQFTNTKLNKAIQEYVEIQNKNSTNGSITKYYKDKKIGNVRHRVFEKQEICPMIIESSTHEISQSSTYVQESNNFYYKNI